MKKNLLVLTFIFALVFGLASCENTGGGLGIINPHENEKVSIKDLDWKVEEGIQNSKRYLLLTLTNNSNYTIHEFELDFRPKSNFKGETLEQFYEFFQTEYKKTDEEMTSLKEDGVLRIECNLFSLFDEPILSGKSDVLTCEYYGYIYVYNDDYFEYFEPDMMTIVYEDEGYLYTVYYDYKSGKYSHESEPELLD